LPGVNLEAFAAIDGDKTRLSLKEQKAITDFLRGTVSIHELSDGKPGYSAQDVAIAVKDNELKEAAVPQK